VGVVTASVVTPSSKPLSPNFGSAAPGRCLITAWAAIVALVVFRPSSPADGYPLWSGPGSMADISLIGIGQMVVARCLASLATQPAIAEQTADAPAAEDAMG